MNSCPIDEKFKAFKWNVITIDGHNYDEILDAIEKAKNHKGEPTAILCKTVKGKGVSFMENQCGWHGNAPSDEQYKIAISEIDEYIKTLGGDC